MTIDEVKRQLQSQIADAERGLKRTNALEHIPTEVPYTRAQWLQFIRDWQYRGNVQGRLAIMREVLEWLELVQ